jgi:putative membrane protein
MVMRNNRLMSEHGAPDRSPDHPDLRFVLANERTFLAWNRTALALMAAGLAATQLLAPGSIPGGRRLLGIPLILFGTVISWLSYARWKTVGVALRRGEEPPASTLPRLLAATVLAGGVLALVVAVTVGSG